WIAMLVLRNVHERRAEIGLLRAIGLRSSRILMIFLGKSVAAGVFGSAAGCALGVALGTWWFVNSGVDPAAGTNEASRLFTPQFILTVVAAAAAAPVLAAGASWLPATAAAQQDPADILCEE
ncbi:MAG: FtsX-like permease family protein, partial [Planctomycetales bacterium]